MSRPAKKKNQPNQTNFFDTQDILDHAPIGVFTSTPEGCLIYANQALADMYGYAAPQDLLASVQDVAAELFADPKDPPAVTSLLATEGIVKNYECEHIRRDGSRFWASGNIRTVYAEDGSVSHYQGFVTEITARKQADRELREQTQRLNSITENMFDMVSVTDLKGNYKYLGPSHAILGHDLDLLIGRNVMELVHPDDYQKVATAFADFLANRVDGRKVEYRYRRADGGYLWLETLGKFILDEQGNPKEILFSTRDFTARKQTEEALQESEKLLSRAQEIAHTGSWRLDLTTNRLTWSDEVYRIFGCEPQEFAPTYEAFLHFVHPDDRAALDDAYSHSLQEKSNGYEIEHRIVQWDSGEVRHVHERCVHDRDPAGTIIQSTGMVLDITERKRAEEALRESEGLLKNILESTLAGYWDWNLVDNTEYLSPTFKRMFGYEDHEMESSPEAWQKILFPEDLPGVLEVFDRHIKSRGQEPYYNEIRYQHKSGSTVWVACAGRIIEWADDGTPIRMVGCHIDITERKQAELALSKSRKIMAQAEELADLGSWEWNIQNDTWLLSDNWKRIHGVADIQLKTPQLLPIAHPEDKSAIEEAFARATENGEPYDIEHRIIRQDTGEVRHVHSRGLVEMDDSGKPEAMVGAAQDITERKKAEEEIKQINKQLERANAEKDKLFSIIAHDLKSPMAGIFGTSEILVQESESLSRDDIRFISAEMNKSTENALALLDDLMQWARMSQGGMDFSPEECCLYELARSSLYTSQIMAEKKDITIKCDIPQGLNVLADQPMINTVFRNIIFNAVKFTPQGGNISVTAKQAGSHVNVCVQDDGIGMNDSVLSCIFTSDKNKRQYGTDGEKGTGLGLILCKEFVEKHGGYIWLESEPGKGTKVCFTLPAVS